jgi:type IV secretion system protein VirD4
LFRRIQIRPLIGSAILTLFLFALVEWLFSSFLVMGSRGFQIQSMSMYVQQPWVIIAQASHEEPFASGQLVFAVAAVCGLIFFYNKMRGKNYKAAAGYGAHGTARFAKPREVFNDTAFAAKTHHQPGEGNLKNPPGLIFGLLKNRPVILPEETQIPNRNVFIVGSPGSGKTQSYILTNMIHERERSMVVTDPKGEIYEATAELKRQQGYDVRLINFKEMTHSDRYNPLDYITREVDAEQVATTLVMNSQEEHKADFWTKAEIALLKTLLLYVKWECPGESHLAKVSQLLTELGGAHQKMDEFFDRLSPDHPAKQAYGIVRMSKDNVRMSIYTSLGITLSKFVTKDVRDFTAQSDFQLDEIGKKKMVLYVILPVADPTWEPLISTFFTQMFQRLYHVADQHFNRLPVKVNLLLDEFPNLGKIPNYEEILATCRSYGISISTIVQSIGQLIDKYRSKEKAEAIVGNCSLRYLLGVGDKLTAEYFSELVGKTTVETFSTTPKKGMIERDTHNHSYTQRQLLTPDELTRMKREKAILLVSGMFALQLKKTYQFDFFRGILHEGLKTSRFAYREQVEEKVAVADAAEDEIEEAQLQAELQSLAQMEEELLQEAKEIFAKHDVNNGTKIVEALYA